MHWVLQENLFHETGFEELVNVLTKSNISHSLHKVIPFIGEILPDIDPQDQNVIVIGSYSMRHLAKKKGWIPGCFDIGDYTYQEQVARWPNHMLNDDAVFTTFMDVPDHFPSEIFFIRPVNDTKVFAGMVTDAFRFQDWWHQVVALGEDDGTSLRPDTEVMISPIKKILREYRLWIVDGEVVTSSLYKQGNRVIYSDNVDMDIIMYGTARAMEWSPARAYVMDIALMENNELKIVETNTINSCGFYAANIARLVYALDDMRFDHERD